MSADVYIEHMRKWLLWQPSLLAHQLTCRLYGRFLSWLHENLETARGEGFESFRRVLYRPYCCGGRCGNAPDFFIMRSRAHLTLVGYESVSVMLCQYRTWIVASEFMQPRHEL